jgi:glutaconate CoA-transferase, subunit B
VDFVSAPGWSPPQVERRGGPVALLTGKALFSWQKEKRRFRLESVHPGHTLQDVRDATGFEFDGDSPSVTSAPTQEEIDLLRGPVRERLAPDYPQFAKRLLR